MRSKPAWRNNLAVLRGLRPPSISSLIQLHSNLIQSRRALCSSACAPSISSKTMKIFEWMHRRLLGINNYSQVYENRDAMIVEDDKARREAVGETDTDALLVHDMLNGILTIGTLSHHHHPLIPSVYYYSEESFAEDGGGGVEEEAAFSAPVAREQLGKSFKIKLSVEEEKRMMAAAKLHEEEEAAAEKNTLELPLLNKYKEKSGRPRTTLADLLANNATDSSTALEEKSEGDQNPPKLPTLISRMSKKKIHPAREAESNSAGAPPPIAAAVASEVSRACNGTST